MSWRMYLPQLCAIHAMLLAIPLNAWRHTRPKEADRAHPCVTAYYSVPTVESSCAVTKKGVGVKQTCVVNVTVSTASLHTIPKRRGTCVTCDPLVRPSLNRRHRIDLFFMILRACFSKVAQSTCEHCSRHEVTCLTCGHQCALCDKRNDDGTHFDKPPLCTLWAKRSDFYRLYIDLT